MTEWTNPKSEAELCERFASLATASGWTVYPETSGWDQLLVRADGVQLGIEAKLKSNFKVLAQALPYSGSDVTDPGPDYRGVLVPRAVEGFRHVAVGLGLICIELYSLEVQRGRVSVDHRRPWPTAERLWVPDHVPDYRAGIPAPIQMTRWKQASQRICETLRTRGWVTSKDFRDQHISISTWLDRWIVNSGETVKEQGWARGLVKYVQRPDSELPSETE